MVLLLGACYNAPQQIILSGIEGEAADSASQQLRRPYGVGYNFVVHADSLLLQEDRPMHWCQGVAETSDSLWVMRDDRIVVAAITACEMTMKIQPTKLIQYDRVELVKPEKREELKADLEERTGLKILKIDVGGIDFLKDSCVLRITYESDNRKYMRLNGVDGQFKVKKSQWNEV